jgi:Protein of unknown function (DUF1559)
MTSGHPRIHELARAVAAYSKEKQSFPPGTVPRGIPSTRAGRPFPFEERVSWLASLLPYLGPEQASLQIDPNKSWRDPKNLVSASTIVPQFLDPASNFTTWWVVFPSLGEPVAATHYVGVAGIGRDAANHSSSEPGWAEKLGVFGYDRATKLSDIKDGTSNTIVMAEVPPVYKRPWLAGGGATVEGVPEKDSIQPFVSASNKGKPGTYVIMADGAVRFVSANVSDEAFKAMCTIDGGKNKGSYVLNRDAVKIEPPEEKVAAAKAQQMPSLSGNGGKGPTPSAPTPGSPAASIPAGWQEIVSNEGAFAVAMPGKPQQMSQKSPSPVGEVTANVMLCPSPDNSGAYMVVYVDLPGAGQVDLDREMETGRDTLQKQFPGAKLANEKKITWLGLPGREFDLAMQGATAHFRVLVVNRRLYQLGTMGMKSPPHSDAFFDSFRLTSAGAGASQNAPAKKRGRTTEEE